MKLVKFIKENKIICLAFLIVLLTFGFLALPGQFAHFGLDTFNSKPVFNYNLSGYEWTFATVKNLAPNKSTEPIGSVVPLGVAAISLLGLSLVGLCFSKKSSFVSLLVSIALIVVAILYFCSSTANPTCYASVHQNMDDASEIGWVAYVIASLNLIAGGLMMFRTILVLKEEAKHPVQQKGPSYSYLKK